MSETKTRASAVIAALVGVATLGIGCGSSLAQSVPQGSGQALTFLDQGWTDALRTLHPEEAIYTFWDYKRNRWPRDAGLRIDHLLLSADLAPRLRDAGVDKPVRGQPGASDHAPTWIILGDAPIRRARASPRPRKAGRKPT